MGMPTPSVAVTASSTQTSARPADLGWGLAGMAGILLPGRMAAEDGFVGRTRIREGEVQPESGRVRASGVTGKNDRVSHVSLGVLSRRFS